MPKLTIHTDNKPYANVGNYNLFRVGHFYLTIEGNGLNEGPLQGADPDNDGDATLGFYPEGVTEDEPRLHSSGATIGITQYSKSYTITESQFQNAKAEIIDWLNDEYSIKTHNCVDFVQAVYNAAGLPGSAAHNSFTEEQLESLDSGAAYYANQKYGNGVYKFLGFQDFGDIIDTLEQNEENFLDDEQNSFIEDRSYQLNSADPDNWETFIRNGEDQIKLEESTVSHTLFVGSEGSELLLGNTGNDVVYSGEGTDALAQYGGKGESYNNATRLIGGEGEDYFGTYGWGRITDIERDDYVFVNNIEVSGGVRPAASDAPVAWDLAKGHGFGVFGGDVNQEEGATLAVKWLWDYDAIAFIDNYTRPFGEEGDGHIEVYQLEATNQWEALHNLWDTIYAIIDARTNPTPAALGERKSEIIVTQSPVQSLLLNTDFNNAYSSIC